MSSHGGGKWVWWSRVCAGEALGTALLVGVGCAALAGAGGAGGAGAPLTHAALAFGGVVAALVAALGDVSGAHLNPAVTLAALVAGRMSPATAALYATAQVAGALGGAALLPLLGSGAAAAAATVPAATLPALVAALLEALLTATLVLVVCAIWRQGDQCGQGGPGGPAPDHSAPLKVGAAIAGLIYCGGALTGASMNPARSLGPAVVSGLWKHHWVYWVGPLAGAALAAALYRWLLTTATTPATDTTPATAPATELLPLSTKEEC